jgi:hypothetical protein
VCCEVIGRKNCATTLAHAKGGRQRSPIEGVAHEY